MSPITIQAQDLIQALENHNIEIHYFLDLESGEITLYTDDWDAAEDQERIEQNPDRFLAIEPISSRDSFQMMSDFTDTVEDSRIHRQLEHALENRRPFRSFKDTLQNHKQLREQWFRYYEAACIAHAKAWLIKHNIDAVIEPFYKD